MRVLTLVALLGLGASAYFAPLRFEARPYEGDDRLIDADAAAMVALADGPERALATGLAGAKRLGDIAKRFRFAVTIWAAAPSQAELPEMVREEVRLYLENRESIDADGAVLRDVIGRWLDVRLANTDFMIQLAPAVWLASRGDKRGADMLQEFIKQGPFDKAYLPYIRRSFHPQWSSVRPIVVHYMDKGDTQGRVLAGASLLDYHSLWGLGADMLKERRAAILRNAKSAISVGKHRIEFLAEPHAVLSSLAMLGGEGIEFLKSMPALKLDENVDLLRVARMWAGLDRFSKIPVGSLKWRLLDPDTQAFYFQGAVHRFLKLARGSRGSGGGEREELKEIVVNGVESKDLISAWTCITGLMALGEPHRTELKKRCMNMGGGFAVLMASTMPSEENLALLLHNMVSVEPLYAGLSATMLGVSGGPPALQDPVD